ncbi:MAG: alginate export family protein, partial [Candidatus Kapaibacteriales bacterium]
MLGFNLQLKDRYNFAFHIQDLIAFDWSLNSGKYPDLFKIKEANTQELFYIMNPQEDFFGIYDCYFLAKQIFNTIDVTVGRQKIFYGDYHIFGSSNCGNTGRWRWDALKISYKKDKHFVDVFVGGTKIYDPEKISIPFTETEFWGGGIYAHCDFPKIGNIEPFYAYKTAGSTDYINTLSFNLHWLGVRLFNEDFHSFVFDVLGTYQFGNYGSKGISAYGVFAKIGYKFKSLPATPVLSIRESYASGGKTSDNKIFTFEPAFGASDRFYGWMNITTWSNLDDREIVLVLFPKKDFWIEIKYNMFYIPENENFKLLTNLKLKPGKNYLGNELNILKY